jgi:hypothetical protein
MKKILVAAFVVFMSANLSAAQAADVSRPAEIGKAIAATTPYGTGDLSRLFIVAYDASLWTDADTWSYRAPFALSLRYQMGFTRDELTDRTISEMVGQGEVPAHDQAAYRAFFAKAYTDVKKGDRFTAVFVPPATMRLYHNGALTGQREDAVFAKRFFDIWLSEKTTEPALRRGLLKVQ